MKLEETIRLDYPEDAHYNPAVRDPCPPMGLIVVKSLPPRRGGGFSG